MQCRLCLSILVIGAPLRAEGKLAIDVGALAGWSARQASTGEGLQSAFAYGAYAGGRFHQLAHLPLRAEIAFFSDTHGGGDGGETVDVSAWQGELLLLGGLDLALWKGDVSRWSIELLLGPGLRFSYAGLRVYEESKRSLALDVLGALVAGFYYGRGGWRLGVRAMGGWPRQRIVQLCLSAGLLL
jgi:hypothetical protein